MTLSRLCFGYSSEKKTDLLKLFFIADISEKAEKL